MIEVEVVKEILEEHKVLDEKFNEAFEALLRTGKVGTADERFESLHSVVEAYVKYSSFLEALMKHKEKEEKYVLPYVDEKRATTLRGHHKRLYELLGNLKTRLAEFKEGRSRVGGLVDEAEKIYKEARKIFEEHLRMENELFRMFIEEKN